MKFQIYPDKKGEYRWRLLAHNGKIIADSGEGYKRKAACVKGVKLIQLLGPSAALVFIPAKKK